MLKMDFGYNFSCQWAKEPFNFTYEEVLDKLSKTDIDCIELQLAVVNIINKKGDVNKREKKRFMKLLQNYNINVGSIHAPYPHFTPTYLDFLKGKLREEALNSIKNSINIANEFNAKVVVLHPTHTYGFYKDEVIYEKRITKKIIENLIEIRDYIESNGFDLILGLETMAPKKNRVIVGDKPQEIVKIVTTLKSKKIGITWDMCHTYKSLVKYNLKVNDLKQIAKYCCHIHYSSFSPILSQCHCPVHYGRTKTILKMISLLQDYDGIVINEISPVMLIYLNPTITIEDWLQEIISTSRKDFRKWMH